MKIKTLILFMPSIEGVGVEKNLIILSSYFVKRIKNTKLISAENRLKSLFNKKISFISPDTKFFKGKNKIFKYLVCLFLLFKEYLDYLISLRWQHCKYLLFRGFLNDSWSNTCSR